MTKDSPKNGPEWVASRVETIANHVADLDLYRQKLKDLELWLPIDEERRGKIMAEMEDYLGAINAAPERASVAHGLTCLEGPNLSIPCGVGSLAIQSYVWRVDSHFRMLIDLARNRYAYERIVKNPPATPLDQLSTRERMSRAYRKDGIRGAIYEDFENRPEHLVIVQTMIADLEAAVGSELDGTAMLSRYTLEKLVLDITGAQALRWRNLKMTMSEAELLAEAEVASDLPLFPPKLRNYDPAVMSDDLWSQVTAANHAVMDRYRQSYNEAWRSLTVGERTEVLKHFSS